ncbi:MAG TPA: amino acid adenylation domain-containing protein, partial [Longimicrobium sp.]
ELTFELYEWGGGLIGAANYSTELFDHDTGARFVAEYQRLLAALLAQPAAPISAPSAVDEAERRLVVETWNATAAPAPLAPLHRLFEAQAAETPDALALVFDAQRLTFAELNARANRLARRLVALGVRPEIIVALALERSVEMVIALLAVNKAGGAFLPVDPDYPADRRRWMLEDSAARLILTTSALAADLPETDAAVVALDTIAGEIEGEDDANLSVDLDVENAAYVIFTSGSTGRPKGVVVPHRGIGNLAAVQGEAFGVEPGGRVLQFASFSFDAAVAEVVHTLLNGAALVVARPEEAGADLLALMRDQAVNVATLPPSLLAALAADELPELRTIISAGEAVSADVVARWGAGRRFVNGYGPTENTVCVSLAIDPSTDGRPPIGRPVANVRAYVLDAHMQPVPVGVPGELYVGGVGVARGYLARAGQTAERFVPDPFAADGTRLYRTGDRVRWLRGGELEFLGRVDQQVKVRGYRIEPGEIEAALRAEPSVRDAVVIARRDGAAPARLVAYVVPADPSADAPIDAAALRAHLAGRLPAYMVPAAFVSIPAVPTTPSGKTDVRALPAPAVDAASAHALPETPAEETLAAVWAAVLGVAAVGVRDNFFALGGDSILAIQVVSRAARAGLRLTARQLFQHQTVAELARVAVPVEAGATAATAEQGPVVGPAPLTPIQRWFFAHQFADAHHWNMASLFAAAEPVDAAAMERAVAAVIEHHDALRLRFTRGADGEWTQAFAAPGDPTPFEVADFTAFAGDALSRVIEAHAAGVQAGLDLEHGPLTRVVLYRAGQGEPDRLLWVIHHLAVDGVSWNALLEDLGTAYTQASSSADIQLPPRTTSFRRWAQRLAEWANGADARAEAAWWLSRRWDDAAPIPRGHAAADDLEGDARAVEVEVDEDSTRALLQQVPPVYGTQVNDALLAALARVLARWTGGSTVAVELEGHGREELFDGVDLSRTVGWFTSGFPLLLDASPADAGALLRETKERLRAVPRRGVGFGALRWLAADEETRARLAALPSPEVVFNYLGQMGGGGGKGDAWLTGARESAGPNHSPRARRTAPVQVLAAVAGGRLRVSWELPGLRYSAAEGERLAAEYLDALREIVAHCRESAGGYTPSDFPLIAIDPPTLDRVLAGVGAGPRGTVDDVYPLTPLQEGMLFHGVADEAGAGVYFEDMRYALRGELDEEAMVRAWAALAERHPVLRTAFAWRGVERPLQVVLRDVTIPVERIDFRGLSTDDAEARIAAYVAEDRARGFDPGQAPLTRVALVRTGDEAWELLWSAHHLLFDGWSAPRLLEDLDALYRAFTAGDEPRLVSRRPFRDHVEWLESRDPGAAEAFWRRELEGFEGAPPLFGEAAAATPRAFAEARALLTPAAAERLRARAGRAGLTVTTLYQGAWALLLARYTGESDVAFGNTVSGRSPELEGAEEMVGMLINTIPVRARVPADAPAGAWLRVLQDHQAEARQYDYAPLVEVRRWAGIDPGRELFDTLFVYENYPVPQAPGAPASNAEAASDDASTADAVEVVLHAEPRERTHYPLSLAVAPMAAGTELRLTYDAERFDGETMRRMLGHFVALVHALADAGERPLSAVEMLAPAEARALVERGLAPPLAEAPSILSVFARRVAEAPDATAVVSWNGERWTYAELDARAGRLARLLRRAGAGPETRVAVMMERSAAMVAALYAVLKAGAAYVPVDPGYPAERIAHMLADSGALLVLTQSALLGVLPATEARVIAVDADDLPEGDEGHPDLPDDIHPEALAYAIYTSGSTGTPKGAAIPHRALANHMAWMQRAFPLAPGDRVLQKTPFSFDASVWEFHAPLLAGATLVMAHPDAHRDPALLAREAEAHGATVLQGVPTLLRAMLDEGVLGHCRTLRRVFAGGEALSAGLAREIGAALPGAAVVNLYGPTETCIDATAYVAGGDEPGPWVPLGRPVDGTAGYVLDAALRLVPQGVAGELCLGGAQVGRGYLGRPAMTAERFVPDPFSPAPGARMYRTGDCARWNGRGEIEFLGRLDQQVKVRGIRIEPGEVETVLRAHPAVRDAVVDTRGDEAARRLVAYVVPAEGAVPDAAGLEAHAALHLPSAMVPSAFVVLAALPLTPSGKVDRRALPEPEVQSTTLHQAPRTPAEEILAGIWADLLGVERVGAGDSFFELGGHSLLAMRMVSRVREAFGVDLPIRAVFENDTLASLAARLDGDRRADADDAVPPLVPVPRDAALPLSYGQERLWAVDRLHAGAIAFTVATLSLFDEDADAATLAAALTEVVRRHEVLRTVFREGEAGPVQVVEPPFAVELPVTDLRALAPDAQARAVDDAVRAAAAERFALDRLPLLGATLLRLSGTSVLVFRAHHTVYDGWSARVLEHEMRALYDAFARGEPSPLPALPVQYADWAAWQRRWLEGGGLDAQMEWWRHALAGAPALLELPADRPRPAVLTHAGADLAFTLPPATVAAARALARGEGATLFMVLLAAYHVLLGRLSGSDDVVVGTQVAGRTRGETEGLIGFFLNNLALRGDLSGDPSFRAMLGRVREATLNAYAHQDVPFQKLVDVLGVERSLTHTPVFQATFILQTTGFDAAPALAEGSADAPADVPAVPVEHNVEHDLTFELRETPFGAAGTASYSTELFEHETAARFVADYRRLLGALVAHPDAPISAPPAVDEAERRLVVETWNATAAPVPVAPLHRLFEAQAARTPGAPALVFGAERLTYAELNARANRLARRLVALGVGPETIVALALERGVEMVIALLAVNKAGGAFLPVDPDYPAERRGWMLEDSAAPLVVTTSALAAGLPRTAAAVVALDRVAGEIEGEDDANLPVEVDVENAAYLIFTSGSTGRPKGVVVPHRGIGNMAAAMRTAFGVEPGGRALQFASFSFDAAVAEVVHALFSGDALVMARREQAGPELLALMRDEAVNVAILPPSLLAALPADELPELRTIVSAGEAVSADVVARWGAGRRFVNGYGPTENTVGSTIAVHPRPDGRPPIGRPIANVRAYVLDRRMRPVPVGVPGELYVGGIGVARGYLARAGQTAERFVPDPFSTDGTRLYRTGDRVRWLRSGELDFLGRVDQQVKVRGFRIEPGEVEGALRTHPSVRDAVVIARHDPPAPVRLVAYVVPADGVAVDAIDADALREHVAARLPGHMVPSAVVALDRIPLTPNGKVDRRALPAPAPEARGAEPAAPRTPVEEALAAAWAGVLGGAEIGVHDNFFALGGDSILAIQVVSRAARAGLRITARQVFEHPTIAALARVAEPIGASVAANAERGPVVGPAPLTPVQRWFFAQRFAEPHQWNMAFLAAAAERLDAAALERALAAVLAHHDALRLRFARGHDGAWTQA